MADKEKDLELHIGLDIDQFLEEIGLLDEKYQEIVKKIENKKAEVKLKTTMDISAARAVGDKMGEIVAKNKEITALVDLQKAKVKQLEKAWQDVAKSENASVEQQKTAEKAYIKAVTELNRLQARQNRNGILGNMAVLAPDTFRKIEQFKNVIASIGAEYPTIAKFAPALSTMAAGFTLAGTAATAVVTALDKIRENAVQAAKEAMEAGDAIYYLKERLSVNEGDAKYLQGIFKLDNTDIQGVLGQIQKLDKALLSANEDGTKASQAMAKYGESLTNADGSLKDTRQQLEAIASAYAKALAEGKGFQFLTETGMGKFSSLIAGWGDYAKRVNTITRAINESADEAHKLADNMADMKLQAEQVGKVYGNEVLKQMQGVVKYQQHLKATQVNFENMHVEEIRRGAVFSAELEKKWAKVGAIWEKAKSNLTINMPDSKFFKFFSSAADAVIDKLGAQVGISFDEETSVADFKRTQEELQKKADANPIVQEVNLEVDKNAEKINDKLKKTLRDLRASDYEKDLFHLDDEIEELKKQNADKLLLEEVYQEKRKAIEERYAKKQETEIERIKKEAEARIQAARQASEQIQSVFRSETERRIAEIEKQKQAWIKAGADELQATMAAEKQKSQARVSEAERTMRENAKLIKKMQQEEAKGGDWQARVMQWKDKQYMKQGGFNANDVAALQRYGTELVNKLADSTNRIFGAFGGNNVNNNVNNSTTINIDRPVLTDESLVNMLVDRVTEKLVPVMKQAFGGEASNSIG